jgi:hypothetical protein
MQNKSLGKKRYVYANKVFYYQINQARGLFCVHHLKPKIMRYTMFALPICFIYLFAVSTATCPHSLAYYSSVDRCYGYQSPMTWEEANTYCESIHPLSHILDIETEEENNLAVDINRGTVTCF